MKKTISVILALLIAMSSFSFSAFAYSNGEFQLTVDQAVEEHELIYAEEVETNRYYFLMPNGTIGDRGEDVYNDDGTIESYGKFEESWYNEYTDGPAIYWWNSGVADPPTFPGYLVTRYDEDNVYYADVPKAVEHIIWNNNVDGGMDTQADIYNFTRLTTEIDTTSYAAGDSELYPDGLESFDNMIYVINPDLVSVSEYTPRYPREGEWYYYYGKGCYGTKKDGKKIDCIRDDHDHYANVLSFDVNTTDWDNYTKVYCHITENGKPEFGWQSKSEVCTDSNNDGVWEYYLDKVNESIYSGTKYEVVFSSNRGDRTPELSMTIDNIGDVAYQSEGYTLDKNGEKVFMPAWRNHPREIYFDANTTDWKDYTKVFCHIWEAEGDMFHAWQSRKELCEDEDGDGIWSYNLDEAGIYLDETKEYGVIFSNEKGEQIYYLELNSKNIGGTVELSGRFAVDDHDMRYNIPVWKSTVLHFDTNTTGWTDYNRIYCHIYEYGGDSFFNWQAKKQRCEDTDGDGIWTYDLASKGIELENGKLYGVIFSNENGNQTYNLLFDKTVLGDTAYCDDTRYTSPEDSDKEVLSAFWRNQDKHEFGPEMVILVTGEVVGTCIPRVVTEEDMFKEFMVNKLPNAQTLSGKTDQKLIDDIAKVLGFTANEVEFIFNELEIYWYDCAWRKSKSTLPKSNIATPDQLDVHQVVRDYKEESGDKFETKRYYFMMPNIVPTYTPETPDEEKEEAWTWYNKYAESAYIHWDGTDRLDLEGVGNMAMVGDTYDVYYADVPDFVTLIYWNNGLDVKDTDDPMFPYAHRTENIMCEYYDVGESETYPDGLDSFDNMIYVLDEDAQNFGNPVAYEEGEWYYYYGDGCYGTVKDGKTADCIRGDHDHSDRFLYFDANSTNWRYYKKIYCHIWEYGGEPFYDWQKKAELCTDNDDDGIWIYDLAEHNIELDESKQYAVIFSNELGRQTYNLLFDKTVLGDTAYCDGAYYDSPEDSSNYVEFAYWRNQDKTEFGPELRINTIGEVQGTCVPKSTTAYDLFKDFLVTYLENAQIYSGKSDQALLDDLAKELKISADDVERAIKETGVDVEWKHPDKLSVKEAVKNYEEKTGKKTDTIRYYFLMPNGRNGQRRTDTIGGNPFASSWYNTYANKPGVYWWDVAGDLDPPRFPGYYFDESESKDVYFVDLPKDVKSVLWNNYIFESMDTADDPMRAYSRYTDEAILPHQIYSFIPGEQPNGWIYVVDPDSERIFDNGKQTYSGKWYFYYGNGCYGETSDGECIRGDHDHRVYDTYIVAGVEKLCGSSWDVYDMNNKMKFNEKTGAYEITYKNVPVGNHEFMVTKNHQFGPLTPGNPDYNEAKVTKDGSTVTITYTEGVGVAVTVTPPLLGDVDLDGVISIMDATEIQLAVAKKKTLTNEQEKLADTDFDGQTSIMDATAIQLFVAKKITEFK